MHRRKFVKKASLTAASAMVVPTIIPAHVLGKNAPSNQINIGQIGCGRIARDHDLPETMKWGQARIISVCDVDSNRLKDAQKLVSDYYKKKGVKVSDPSMHDDFHKILENKDIDAVIISTPDHWHAQPAIEAANAGKDIYLQKPTALTVKEGQQLVKAVKENNVVFQLGTQQRSMEQFRKAAEFVRSGRIGKIHTVRIGLPGDPSGPEAAPMPVPDSLNFDMWLGSTPEVPYTEIGVHPQKGYGRPGWLRCENYGAGMITGWGQHHFDSAAWGMDTELTGPDTVEALTTFPSSGLWNVHGDFMVVQEYRDKGITVITSNGYTNGIRYEGTDGWIFVSRGSYNASASDPVDQEKSAKALNASDLDIITTPLGKDEVHLYKSEDQHGNWLECIASRKPTISPVDIAHKQCNVCLISHIAMKISDKLEWNPTNEIFLNNGGANAMLERVQRYPYGTDYIS